MKYKVIKSGRVNNDNWIVITKTTNDKQYHSVLRTLKFFEEEEEVEIPEKIETLIVWQESGNTKEKPLIYTNNYSYKSSYSKRGYTINSKLGFGLYSGYEIGIIYAFDIGYIEWCILNIEHFYIIDVENLQEFGVFRRSNRYEKNREIGYAEYHCLIEHFNTIQELSSEFPFLNPNIRLSEEALEKNNKKRAENCFVL